MKETLRVLTSRSNGWGNDKRKEKLKQFITGWVNYFKFADMKNLLVQIDQLLRRRLRMVICKQWKRVKTPFRNLVKLGIPENNAYAFANTRKGYWHVSNSFIVNTSIRNEYLKRAGYAFLSDCYRSCHIT